MLTLQFVTYCIERFSGMDWQRRLATGYPWPYTIWFLVGVPHKLMFTFHNCLPLYRNLMGGDILLRFQTVFRYNSASRTRTSECHSRLKNGERSDGPSSSWTDENVEVIRDDRRQTTINDVCNILGIRRIWTEDLNTSQTTAKCVHLPTNDA